MSHVEKSERKVGRGESRREGVTQSDGEFREQGCETEVLRQLLEAKLVVGIL